MKLHELYKSDLDYVYDNYYVWGEDGDRITIEESKAKYVVSFNNDNSLHDVWPENDLATEERAREIAEEIRTKKDLGYERP